MGKINNAASSGVMPSTNCKRWLNTSSIPISAIIETIATPTPLANRRLRNSEKSIMGYCARC
ncbi:hypothetical protein D3C81_1630930 [compost metagenome]